MGGQNLEMAHGMPLPFTDRFLRFPSWLAIADKDRDFTIHNYAQPPVRAATPLAWTDMLSSRRFCTHSSLQILLHHAVSKWSA